MGINIRNLFQTFFPYEKAIFSAINNSLSPEAQVVFEKQLSMINKVQRLYSYQETDSYCKKRGKIHFDDSLRFPLDLPEVQLAKVKIKYDKSKKPITANIWLVKGRVFSITYNSSPKPLLKQEFEITKVEILEDPMKTIDTSEIAVGNSSVLIWFGEASREMMPIKVYAPLPVETRLKKLKELDTDFPEDWVSLTEICNGFELEQCKVYGYYHIRQVSLQNKDLLVLVEGIDAKMLIVDCSKNDRHVYFINAENDDAELIDFGDSFHRALIQYLA